MWRFVLLRAGRESKISCCPLNETFIGCRIQKDFRFLLSRHTSRKKARKVIRKEESATNHSIRLKLAEDIKYSTVNSYIKQALTVELTSCPTRWRNSSKIHPVSPLFRLCKHRHPRKIYFSDQAAFLAYPKSEKSFFSARCIIHHRGIPGWWTWSGLRSGGS